MTTSADPVRFADIARDPGDLLSFGLGAGCAPFAPGTFGTLVGMALFLVLPPVALVPYLLACAAATVLGAWLCGRTAARLGVHDHSGIVLDEIVGYLITMAAYQASRADAAPDPPATGGELDHLLWALAGFGLFRLFDIAKPWPIGWLDRKIHGGIGIMLDDVAAGLMALLCLTLLQRLSG